MEIKKGIIEQRSDLINSDKLFYFFEHFWTLNFKSTTFVHM